METVKVTTRKEAHAAGLTRYFTGRPCKHGHIAERRVSDGCVVCADAHARQWQAANPGKVKAKGRAYRAANRDALKERYKAWRKANQKKHDALTRAWRASNPERVKIRKAIWRKTKAGDVNETQMRRHAAKMKRLPAWSDRKKIRDVYKTAAELRAIGFNVHVDHEIPLQGRTVSGLHVHENLRIIDAYQNLTKSNHF